MTLHYITVFHKMGDTILMATSQSNLTWFLKFAFTGGYSSKFAVKSFLYYYYYLRPLQRSISVSRHLQCRILSVQSFTVHMPLLTAISAFGLGRRRWSSPQQCYLHCLRTLLLTSETRRQSWWKRQIRGQNVNAKSYCFGCVILITHTHTHTHLTALCPGLPG